MATRRSSPPRRGGGPKLTAGTGTKAKSSGISPRRDAPRARPKRRAAKPARRRLWTRRGLWPVIGSLAFTLLLLGFAAMLYFAHDLPSIRGIDTIKKQPGITMKSRDGVILASYGDVYGDYIPYEKIPKHLIDAVLATEDRRFFEHPGIDLLGIARAMWVNLREGGFVQGGSTITQQVAKNVFLSPDRTFKRKIQEMLLAFWLEGRFNKQAILAIYLNRVYLGAGNYGIDAASKRYFDKPATEINLIEAAVLTGLLKAPSKYSPIANVTLAKQRAHQVLLNMVDAGIIDETKMKVALAEFKPPRLYREGDPNGTRYFTDWVMDELPDYIGQIEQDLVVITTLDPAMQRQAEDAVKAVMDAQGAEKGAAQAALLAMTPDGAIRAMVGGRSYRDSQFNRVTQANRQPGSVFKLFVYLAALEAGMTPASLVTDAPVEYTIGNKIWRPANYTGEFRGTIPLAEALTHSLNTVAVQLTMAIGVDAVAEMAKRLGIQGVRAHPSIALGAVESTLLALTGAYAHLANEGRAVEPYGVEAIYATGGDTLYERQGSGLWSVVDATTVHRMNAMLVQVPVSGTGRAAAIGRPMAGKTGTSSDFKDAWFIGFVPQLVTGVWVGNDDNTPMKKVTGGGLPAQIWHDFMAEATAALPVGAIPQDGGDGGFLPWSEPPSLNEVMQRRDTPERPSGNGPDLNRSFWDKLFKADGTVEYDYPTSGRR